MGKAKRTILAAACAAALVVGSVAATVAYLTSTDTVTNTFTVGNVAITLDEKSVDELGVAYGADDIGEQDNEGDKITGDEEKGVVDRVDRNTYKLLPGHQYVKDPTVHVGAKSEDCYLFVKVENGLVKPSEDGTTTSIEAEANYQGIAAQMTANGWKALGTGYENIYVYVGAGEDATNPPAVSAGEDVAVFGGFKIADSIGKEALSVYSSAQITVTAYAVQEDGFDNKTAAEIWTAAGFTVQTSSGPGEDA